MVDKPVGMAASLPNGPELGAVEWLRLHHSRIASVFSPIDTATSGVLVLAKDPSLLENPTACVYEYLFWSQRKANATVMHSKWKHSESAHAKSVTTEFEFTQHANGYDCYRARTDQPDPAVVYRHALASGVPVAGSKGCCNPQLPRAMLHRTQISGVLWPHSLSAPLPPTFEAMMASHPSFPLTLACCQDRRLGWIRSISNAIRVVHRDELPDCPFACEVYDDVLSVWAYDPKMDTASFAQAYRAEIERLMNTYQCRSALVRSMNRNPHRRQLSQGGYWIGDPQTTPFWVEEHQLKYRIQISETKHTGLFLDQRDSRRKLSLATKGKRVANLFAFTCSFSQVAVAAQAEVVFSVDLAKGCLKTGIENLKANQLEQLGVGKFVQEDARNWLNRQLRRKYRDSDSYPYFDWVICDPPVFAASSKASAFKVAEEWQMLVKQCAAILCPTGKAIFANNHRGGEAHLYQSILNEPFTAVTQLAPPIDFPDTGKTHVRTFWCEK